MGLFSGLFSGFGKSNAKKVAKRTSFLQTYSGGSGGWGLARFRSIINAHSSIEGIVEEWALDDECCTYLSPDGYDNCYTQAYEEEYERASFKAELLAAMSMGTIQLEPEDLMDMQRVEDDAYGYACLLATNWCTGREWIPEEIMNWAWYDLSSHNG